MDRNTLGHYGWIVIVIIIICILISGMPGLGAIFRVNINNVIDKFENTMNDSFDDPIDYSSLAYGLYETGTKNLIKPWDELIDENILEIADGVLWLENEYNHYETVSAPSDAGSSIMLLGLVDPSRVLTGYLVVPPGITAIRSVAFAHAKQFTGIVLPDSVTSIEDGAFDYACDFEFIIFGNGITNIGKLAFANTNLKKISIPKTVESIGSGAFSACNNLEYLTVDANNVNYRSINNCLIETSTGTMIAGCARNKMPDNEGIVSLDDYAYSFNSKLEELYIPNTLTNIPLGAFFGCLNIKTITVSPDNPAYLAKNNCLIEKSTNTLVSGCKNSVIPDDGSVKVITSNAFTALYLSPNFEIAGTVETIGAVSFADCTGISDLTISDGVKTIENAAFARSSVVNVTVPGSVTTVGDDLFKNCGKLKQVTIASGFTKIGASMFSRSTIESISIPSSVTVIGESAFSDCTLLRTITYEGTVASWNSIVFENNWNYCTTNYKIVCSDGTIAKDGTVTYNS